VCRLVDSPSGFEHKTAETVCVGTYQEYLVSPAKYTTRIPDGVPDAVAAPIMCSASTMMRSLSESGLRPGDWAAFPGGAGGVGIQGVQLAKAMGFRPIVIDTGADKQELSLKMGAEHFVDFKLVDNVADEVKKIAGGIGVHGVFVTAPGAYGNATELVGDRISAVIMCIGIPPAGTTVLGADPMWFIGKNRRITGTLVGTMEDTRKALDYAARGLLVQIAEVLPIDRMPEAVERLKKGQVAGRMVVDFTQ
jgi:alcohol dehydrogenase, propanol-preferring